MADHPFDPVALVLGLLSIVAGIVVVVGGELTDEARWLLPIGLNGLGLALLVRTVARRDAAPAPASPGVPAPPTAVDADVTLPFDLPFDAEGPPDAGTGLDTGPADLPEPPDAAPADPREPADATPADPLDDDRDGTA